MIPPTDQIRQSVPTTDETGVEPGVKIGILASSDNGPADFHLGNQLIRRFDVPLVLVRKPRRRGARRTLDKLLGGGPTGLVEWWLNRRFEARRQRELHAELAERFAEAGDAEGYAGGPGIVEVNDVHSAESAAMLREAGVEILFQNGAGILKPPLLAAFPRGILNVHHGWLPAIRGCHSIAWGLLEGRPDWIGVTVHLIDEGLDTGSILRRERLPSSPDDTYASLFFAATLAGGRLLVEAAADLAAGRYAPLPQFGLSEYRPAMTRREWLALRQRPRAGQILPLTP